jgi:acyl-[acyl-carrier-protein]-phospholipid O-acyltransferase / long-chain-fatty-acid--[acyl-carrier-protein] ligase
MCFRLPELLKSRRFLPLFITQFLGAFNDNVFKNALVMLITFKLAAQTGEDAQMLVVLAGALFILPYLLFSAMAGQCADRYDRSVMAQWTKRWELGLMMIAAVGFYTSSIYFLLFVLFCLGVQATFFGPVKYALLPQHLQDNELIAGNAYIEAGTFLAILIGTISGGLLVMQEWGSHLISAAVITVAWLGYLTSRHIPPAAAPMPDLRIRWNIVSETWRMVQNDRRNRRVFLCILGISWFWLVGATFLSQFPGYAKDVIHSDETVVTLFLTMFSVGIGVGSLLCSILLKGQIKSTFVPWAAMGLSAFTIDLYFASNGVVHAEGGALMHVGQFLTYPSSWRILFDLFGVSVCAGLYIVPLYAIMQHDSDPSFRARTIASNNVVNALFMVLSAVGIMLMLGASFTVPQVFLTIGLLNAAVAWYIMRLEHVKK